jgi:hypothetical protein
MPINNNIWYAKPMRPDIVAPPPVIMGDLNSDSQIKTFLHDVPPTICFGRLVFEHAIDLNLKLIRIKNPKPLRTVMEVTTSSGLSLQINLTIQIMAPDSDNEEPGDEIVHESRPIFMAKSKWGAGESELSASHTPRCRDQRPNEIYSIKIAKSGYYME